MIQRSKVRSYKWCVWKAVSRWQPEEVKFINTIIENISVQSRYQWMVFNLKEQNRNKNKIKSWQSEAFRPISFLLIALSGFDCHCCKKQMHKHHLIDDWVYIYTGLFQKKVLSSFSFLPGTTKCPNYKKPLLSNKKFNYTNPVDHVKCCIGNGCGLM